MICCNIRSFLKNYRQEEKLEFYLCNRSEFFKLCPESYEHYTTKTICYSGVNIYAGEVKCDSVSLLYKDDMYTDFTIYSVKKDCKFALTDDSNFITSFDFTAKPLFLFKKRLWEH